MNKHEKRISSEENSVVTVSQICKFYPSPKNIGTVRMSLLHQTRAKHSERVSDHRGRVGSKISVINGRLSWIFVKKHSGARVHKPKVISESTPRRMMSIGYVGKSCHSSTLHETWTIFYRTRLRRLFVHKIPRRRSKCNFCGQFKFRCVIIYGSNKEIISWITRSCSKIRHYLNSGHNFRLRSPVSTVILVRHNLHQTRMDWFTV